MAMSRKLVTMTVKELKAYLDKFPDHKPVAFAYPAKDHWRTELVSGITRAEYVNVTYSGYHKSHQKADEDNNEKTTEILILM